MKKHLLLSTLLVAVALPVWADTNPRTGEELADNQAYTYRMLDSVKSLDPQLISSVEDSDVARGLFEGLFNEDGDGNLVPAGAVSFTVSDDKLTYTFKLRPESKWSDGTPVTAADYVYGWQRLVDPALASEYAYYLELAQVKNAAAITAGTTPASELGVKAVDDLTLEVTLDNPIPYFTKMLTNTSTFPAPKAAIEKFGADWTKPENIVTNGAYLLKDFVDGEKYVELGCRQRHHVARHSPCDQRRRRGPDPLSGRRVGPHRSPLGPISAFERRIPRRGEFDPLCLRL